MGGRTAAWVLMRIGTFDGRPWLAVVPRSVWKQYRQRRSGELISSHRTKDAAHAAREKIEGIAQ